ncbi:enoyl-CoA-hydratase DpgB [Kineosporia sp. NBRC 101677]|uniref:enoyl-CoA-hydratase DpgB n=1 Tax=Kineosporia sp. NBRC 101677 TaxID=3032197 RepID=UPI002555A8D5|nr:enoyl-CoA-hydratase DpgB [Kineosporia sp. NBRC 101677]
MTTETVVRLRIDGAGSPGPDALRAVEAACQQAEATPGTPIVVEVSGTPHEDWLGGLDVTAVSRWERALRRLESSVAVTLAVATGECGGIALDALLVTDYRIASAEVALCVPVGPQGPWPGMAAYRLAAQAGAGPVRSAVLFGTPIPAARALTLGLLDEVHPDPEGAVPDALSRITGFGGEIKVRRQLMFNARTVGYDEALGSHLAACDRVLRPRVTR